MTSETAVFILIGFVAQMVDGAVGMAYGLISTSILLSIGISPVTASASIHIAEVFTAIASGLSHLAFGNVDLPLFRRLVMPGVLGAFAGATVLTRVQPDNLRRAVALYLLVMGVIIILKAFRRIPVGPGKGGRLVWLGLCGGFFDAVGGGGWGAMVTSTLMARGTVPRMVIGTVNLAEFFVAFTASMTFLLALGSVHWEIIIGLLTGGILAAPLAAVACQRLNPRVLMIIVGSIIIILSARTIFGLLS